MNPDEIREIQEQIRQIVRSAPTRGLDPDATRDLIAYYLEGKGFSSPEAWSAHVREFETSQMEANSSAPEMSRPEAAAYAWRQGATFGLSDELRGALAAFPGGMSPSEAIQEERDMLAAAREQYPGTTLAADIGGSIPSTMLATLLNPVAGVQAASNTIRAAPTLGNAVRSGAMIGAFEGINRAEGDITSLEGVQSRATGGAVGSVAGAAGGVAGNYAMRGLQGAGNLIKDLRGIPRSESIFGFLRPDANANSLRPMANRAADENARRRLVSLTDQYIGNPNQVENTVEDVIRRAGPLADALSPVETLGPVGQGVGIVSGMTNGQIARNASQASNRMLSGSVRDPNDIGLIGEVIEEATGVEPGANFNATLSGLVERAATKARNAYNRLFQDVTLPERTIPQGSRQQFATFLNQNREILRDAVDAARRRDPGARLPMQFIEEGRGLDALQWIERLDARGAHALKKGLDEVWERASIPGSRGPNSGTVQGVIERYRSYVDTMLPSFRDVRAQAANEYDIRDAFDAGKRWIKNGETGKDALEQWETRLRILDESPTEVRETFVLGALTDMIEDMKAGTSALDGGNPVNWITSNKGRLGRLRDLIGDNDKFVDLVDRLFVANEIGQRGTRTVGGSPTAIRQELARALNIEDFSLFTQQAYNLRAAGQNFAGRQINRAYEPQSQALRQQLAVKMFGPGYRGASGSRRLVDEIRSTAGMMNQEAIRNANAARFGAGVGASTMFANEYQPPMIAAYGASRIWPF